MITLHDPMRPRRSPRYALTREQLREIARKHGVRRGRNTADTVANLRRAGRFPETSTIEALLDNDQGKLDAILSQKKKQLRMSLGEQCPSCGSQDCSADDEQFECNACGEVFDL